MGFLIISIILSIIVLPFYFWVSLDVTQWIVWILYAIITPILFIKNFTEYDSALKGEPKNVADVIGIAAYPFVTSIMGIVLIVMIFVDINKLHLLWIYPLVALIFEFTIGKKAANITHPDLFEGSVSRIIKENRQENNGFIDDK
jgi:hypothetical protein